MLRVLLRILIFYDETSSHCVQRLLFILAACGELDFVF